MFINYYMLNIANFLLLSDGFLLYSFNKFCTFSGRLLSLEIIVILFSNYFKADGYMKTFSRTAVSPRERTVSPVESIECSKHWFSWDTTIKSHRWSVLNNGLTFLHLWSLESQDHRADRAGSEKTYILAFRWIVHHIVSSFDPLSLHARR